MAERISKKQQEILSQIVPFVVEKLGVAPDEVKMEASLSNDLGADSLDRVELMMKFEEEFNLCIPDYDPQQEEPRTIGEVVMLIEQNSEKYSKTSHQFAKPNTNEKEAQPPKKPTPKKNTEKSATPETIFSGNIMNMTVEQALGQPEFQVNLFYVLKKTGVIPALKLPLGELLTLYLQKQQEPQK